MKSKLKKIIKTIIIIIIVILLVLLIFYSIASVIMYLDADSSRYTHSVFLNDMARHVGYTVDENLDSLALPKDETIILTGECFDELNILIYTNKYLNKGTVIGDYDSNDYNRYWAVKIDFGEISEAWFSKGKIKESDLRPYTREEQYEHMYFVVPMFSPARYIKYGFIDDGEVYGYYHFNKTDNAES